MILKQYVLLILTLFLGPLFGGILAYIAPEELKIGKKYFIYLQKALIYIIIFFLLFNIKIDLFTSILSAILIALTFFRKDDFVIAFYLMGFVIYGSLIITNTLIIQSSLIFIFGIISGINYCMQYEKNERITKPFFNLIGELIVKYFLFVILAILPYWLL